MYKRILVPLDGSKRAEAILPHVEELAHRFNATIIFLEVIEPLKIPHEIHGYALDYALTQVNDSQLKDGIRKYISGIAGEFREKNIPTKYMVELGPVVNKIINVAERENVDLIAMSSHGYTGLAHVFYGSVAAGVLHRIDRPLLLVRTNY